MRRIAINAVLVATFAVGFAPACEWDYAIWIPRSLESDALYRFRKGDRMGYINQNGEVVIPPSLRWSGYNAGDEFSNGLLQVSAGEGSYIDIHGKAVKFDTLYRAWDFSEGLAAAMPSENGKWGYIDAEGKFAISPRFSSGPQDYVSSFANGVAMIQKNGRYGYIDHSGNFVIAPTLLDADSFHEGFARVVVEGPCVYAPESPCLSIRTPGLLRTDSSSELKPCKFTFVDKRGRVISDKRYDYALHFSEGFAPVRLKGKWGYIDRTGELVIEPRFDRAEPFSDDLALVKENGLYGFIDKRGVYVVAPQFQWAESFAEGRAVVGIDGYKGPVWFIDEQGTPLFHRKFAAASNFFKGLAHVKLQAAEQGFEYLDRDGRTVFAYIP